ncbi:TerD family protein [Streptomyces sp. NPDC048603]|uniref:TerD family protein n=1 Tax=Streptomyces sp. NPDC048603 TaxID=3365577 RepID=UPI00371AE334
MPMIIKGANTPLPDGPFRITVARTARPDTPVVAAAAVLLDAAGRVRDGSDVVVGDRPRHPSGAVRYLGGAQEGGLLVQRLEMDPDSVEPSVQRVLIAAVTAGGPFGAVEGLSVEVAGGDGTPVARYEVTDATGETALVLGECYRRDGAWRFRAVGQGHTAGPAALAAEFGIPPAALPAPPVPGPPTTEVHKEAAPAPGARVAPVLPPVPGTAALPGTSAAGHHGAAGAAGAAAPFGPEAGDPGYTGSAVLRMPGAAGTPGTPGAQEAQDAQDAQDAVEPGTAGDAGPGVGGPQPDDAAGEVFHEYRGRGDSVLTLGPSTPEGPLMIEAFLAGHGYFNVHALDRRNRRDELLFNSPAQVRNGRTLAVRGRKALRLRIETDGEWTLRVLPVGAARPLTTATPVSASGPDVLRHDGPASDLRIRHQGSEYDVAVIHTARPDRPDRDAWEVLATGSGRFDTTHPLLAGPLLIVVEAEAPWTAEALPIP